LNTTAQSSLVSAINEVVALVGSGTSTVRSDYNATIFTFQSGSAATTHTVTHNLASNFVDVALWVQRADSSWYNDLASIKVLSNNEVEVYLSTAQNVRVICRSAATI
jgi:hypothetical protein